MLIYDIHVKTQVSLSFKWSIDGMMTYFSSSSGFNIYLGPTVLFERIYFKYPSLLTIAITRFAASFS